MQYNVAVAGEPTILCFLDVLGFESLFSALGLKGLDERYSKLIEYVKKQTGGVNVVPTPDGHVAVGRLIIGNAYFSDTLLFWTHYSTLSLSSFTQSIAETICHGLEIGLALRGTIVVGEMILDTGSGKYLGDPIIEAARTERLQRWIGVSFGRSFSQPEFNKGFYLNTVLSYKSHYKDVATPLSTGMVVDWPRKWRETRKSDLRALVSSMDTNPQYSDYYANTLRFIDFSERNHDWFKKQGHLDYG